MTVAFLDTKTQIPPIRPLRVRRARLFEHIQVEPQHKLVLISAPAGFGKTSLLLEWIHQKQKSKHKISWLSLEPEDNDLDRFLTYLVRSIQSNHESFGKNLLASLNVGRSIKLDDLLSDLIHDFTDPDHYTFLVCDDYHCINNPAIHETIQHLLDHLPPGLKLVVSSRSDPPWPLARFRVHRTILEIRGKDLRFTDSETTDFIRNVMSLNLSNRHIQLLNNRTEGWAAGLQMAALSLQGRSDVESFIKRFSGSNRYIIDYLLEEVLEQLDDETHSFLLDTSILSRLTAPLCDHVTERNDSQEILNYLEHRNLFLLPLDDERCWYRFHHLFGDLLNHHLKRKKPGQIASLHRKAQYWYLKEGLVAEAVGHAIQAGDVLNAADLVEAHVLDFKDYDKLPHARKWLEALPETIVNTRPWLCIAKGWVLAYIGQPDESESLLVQAENLKSGLPDHEPIEGHVAAIRCYNKLFQGELDKAAVYGRIALQEIPGDQIQVRQSAATTLASVLRLLGKLSEAKEVLDEALAMTPVLRRDQTTLRMLNSLASQHIFQAALIEADETFQKAISLAFDENDQTIREEFASIGHLLIRRSGGVLLPWNRLDEAEIQVQEGLDFCQSWGQANALMEGYLSLSRIYLAQGKNGRAIQAMNKSEKIAQSVSPWLLDYINPARVAFWLRSGDYKRAYEWAENFHNRINQSIQFSDIEKFIYLAEIFVRQSKYSEALIIYDRIAKVAESSEAWLFALEIYIGRALLHQINNNRSSALKDLIKALKIAEPENLIRPFVDHGLQMRDLLEKGKQAGQDSNFIEAVLSAITGHPVIAERNLATTEDYVEQLSDRELEVLKLLPTSLTGPEIAEELVIAVSTVRSHIKSIYGKLGTHNRIETVDKARTLNLIK